MKSTWNQDTREWEPSEEYYARKARRRVGFFLPDIEPFLSPVTREMITSRPQLREHEKRHQVRQCGELKQASDYSVWGDWKPTTTDKGTWQ